jgi:arsenate reductase-like glutaredoxin family protein
VDTAPVDRAATLALARGARALLVKSGDGVLRLDAPLTESDIVRSLVHEDGFLRVPVLVLDDVLVRGYTEELYRAAFGR